MNEGTGNGGIRRLAELIEEETRKGREVGFAWGAGKYDRPGIEVTVTDRWMHVVVHADDSALAEDPDVALGEALACAVDELTQCMNILQE